jgi:hypothetical protein
VSIPAALEDVERARWLAPVAACAVIAIGRALQIANGVIHPDALFWVTVAFVLVLAAVVVPRPARLARLDGPLVRLLALGGLVAHAGQLYTASPGLYLRLESTSLVPFQYGVVALAVLGVWLIWGEPRWAKPLQVGALIAVHFALGAWMIRQVPEPLIDVHVFQRDAVAALREGVDPYTITFPDIYGHDRFYGQGLSTGGRLQFGFPYLPLSLLTALPGQLLGGDHRYSQLVAMELAALLMAFGRATGFGPIAAVLYLTTPRIFFVLEQSWTEPFVVLGVAAVVFAACRNSRAVPWLFGAFAALKQYLVFTIPAALLLLRWPLNRDEILRLFGKAAMVAGAVTLPFIVWSPSGFWHSVVTLQMYQPFRPDALSFLAWWADRGHDPPGSAVAFLAMATAAALAVWRLPATPAGFAGAIAVTFFAFFAFNKQAFGNYYFFVIGALAATLAAWRPPEEER